MSAEGKDTVMAVMRRDRDNFTRLVSDPKNWNVTTRCIGWEVRDLVGHMIDVIEGYFNNWDAAGAGKEGTALGLPVMAETLNDHALDFRKLSRQEALDRFNKDALKLDRLLQALTPEEWTGFMVYHPFAGPVPAGFFGTFQIMDYGVHPYDIEYGLGNRLATIDEASAGLILPFAFIFWQYTVDEKVAKGEDFVYGIQVDGPWGGKWRVTVMDGKWSPQPEKGNFEGVDALIHFSNAADMVLTFFGRYPGGSASGDPEAIDRIRHLHFLIDVGGGVAPTAPNAGQSPGIEWVAHLQRLLNLVGYWTGDIDGVFGTSLKEAVTKFQAGHGLKPSGVVLGDTWKALVTETDQVLGSVPVRSRFDINWRSEYPEIYSLATASDLDDYLRKTVGIDPAVFEDDTEGSEQGI